MSGTSGVDPTGPQGPRLDIATLTVSVYPTSGEVSMSHHRFAWSEARRAQHALTRAARKGSPALDPEASLRSSLARSRRKIRRWCSEYSVSRLATLTFADEPSLDDGWAAIEGFRRRLRAAGIAEPLVVPEYGSKGGRLHFHLAMPQYVAKADLARLWGHGFVDIRKVRPKGRRHAVGGREGARIIAGYISAYVSKWDSEGYPEPARAEPEDSGQPAQGHAKRVGMNRRRYSVPIGTSPRPVTFVSFGIYEAWQQAERMIGSPIRQVWSSAQTEDWRGPPTMLAFAV